MDRFNFLIKKTQTVLQLYIVLLNIEYNDWWISSQITNDDKFINLNVVFNFFLRPLYAWSPLRPKIVTKPFNIML